MSEEVVVNKQSQPESLSAQPAKEGLVPTLCPVDIYENAEEFLIVADLPGVAADALNVQLDKQKLSIEGRQRPLQEGRDARLFARSFQVPKSVDPEGVSAELSAGVLTLHLKKAAHSRPREIPVTAH